MSSKIFPVLLLPAHSARLRFVTKSALYKSTVIIFCCAAFRTLAKTVALTQTVFQVWLISWALTHRRWNGRTTS